MSGLAADALLTWRGVVEPGWIDVNDHANVSAYDRIIDAAEGRLFDRLGINDDTIAATGLTIYRLERLIAYERELRRDEPIETRCHLIWFDARRIHHFIEIWNVARDLRAAAADTLSLHVDLRTRRAARAWQPGMRAALDAIRARQSALPRPAGVVLRVNGRRTPA